MKNFAPRTGVSYRVTETSVVRAGYGVSTIPFPDNSYAFNFPVKQNNDFNAPNTFAPAPVRMADGFPAPILADIPTNGVIPANTPLLLSQRYFAIPTDLHEGRLQSWNAAYQRQLPKRLHSRGRLRRQSRERRQYDQSRTRAWCSAPTTRAGRSSVRSDEPRKRPRGCDRTRPTTRCRPSSTSDCRNGLLITTSYTLGRSINYWQGRHQWRHRHASRSRAQPRTRGIRSFAQLRSELRLSAAGWP